MTRTLVLMRHAKSSWEVDTTDERRELSERGQRDARAAGEVLASRGLTPLVLVSPTRRTHATWEGMQAAGAGQVGLREVHQLYGHDTDVIIEVLRDLPDDVETVLCLGHSPTTPELVEALARRESTKPWFAFDEKFPTAAMAILEVDGPWSDLGVTPARLVDYLVPRGA